MRLYTVTLTVDMVVVAENEEGAKRVATAGSFAASSDLEITSISPMSALPSGYRRCDLPYLLPTHVIPPRPLKTIGEWIDDGAAPEYSAALTGLKAASERMPKDPP